MVGNGITVIIPMKSIWSLWSIVYATTSRQIDFEREIFLEFFIFEKSNLNVKKSTLKKLI